MVKGIAEKAESRQFLQVFIVAVGILVATGALLGGALGAVLLPVGLIGTFCAVGTTSGRLLMLCFGAMLMFGPTLFGGTIRSLFLLLLIIGSVFALASIARKSRGRLNCIRRFYPPLLVFTGVPIVTMYIMAYYSTDVTSWIRDATTFILIPIGIVYGIDAGLSLKTRTLQGIFAVLGILAAFVYLTSWLVRRQQLPPGAELPLLSSSMISIPVICMSLTLYFTSGARSRYVWGLVAVIQMLMLVSAGGRSSVLYCTAIILFISASALFARWGVVKLLILLGVAAGIAVGFFTIYVPFVRSSFLSNRLDWFSDVSLDAVERDGSGEARLRAYRIMWESFLEKPLLGNGFGYSYPPVSAAAIDVFTLDTPLVYLAKFGVIGTFAILFAVVGLVRACVRLAPQRADRLQVLMMWGSAIAAWAATLPSGAPTEQKGFGIGLAVLIAVSVAWCRRPGTPPSAGKLHEELNYAPQVCRSTVTLCTGGDSQDYRWSPLKVTPLNPYRYNKD
jgi:hypothetical protein